MVGGGGGGEFGMVFLVMMRCTILLMIGIVVDGVIDMLGP